MLGSRRFDDGWLALQPTGGVDCNDSASSTGFNAGDAADAFDRPTGADATEPVNSANCSWTRVRVNLQQMPEPYRWPLEEPLDPGEDLAAEWHGARGGASHDATIAPVMIATASAILMSRASTKAARAGPVRLDVNAIGDFEHDAMATGG